MEQYSNGTLTNPKPAKWRVVLCVILGLMIIGNMALIFGFSTEDRTSSGDRSHGITQTVVQIIIKDFENLPPEEQEQKVQQFHVPIRKIAHFCEFGLLGLLTAAFMRTLGKGKKWLWWIIPMAFCLLYAISDEVHQMFTERGPAVADVLLDFSGSLAGICVIHLVAMLACHIRAKRKAKRLCE